jgi:hypothetical protein
MMRSAFYGVALFALSLNPCDQIKAALGQGQAAPDTTTLTPAPVVSPEQQLMVEADQLCTAGDCQSAHDRLAVGLPPNSPIRQTDAFKALENKWAAATVGGAIDDPDVMTRRKQLADVIASPAVTADLKTRAQQALAIMPTKPLPDPPLYDGGPTVQDAGAKKAGGKKHH